MQNKFVQIAVVIVGIIALNVLSSYVFIRWDLTEEKRFSLSDATKNLLKNLNNEVVVKVYLEGDDFPSGFKRLHDAVQETLDEFKVYGGAKIDYRFINPSASADTKKREAFYEQLYKKGILPTNLVDNKNGRRSEMTIFPWATITYQNREIPVLLLKGTQGLSADEKLNQSYENVEYELASVIRKLAGDKSKKIGLITQFTKVAPIHFAGLIDALHENYDSLFFVDSKTSPTFIGLDAIILPKPDLPIDDSTKYKIDQFIVNGGRALFFLDGLKVDSIGLEGNYAQPLRLNMEDLLFKYGVRVNENLIKDGSSCAMIPMNVGTVGDKPNIQLMPYRFFPLINNFGKSLITNNLDLISTKFDASIDTVRATGIKKTPLLMTTPYTKVLNAPALVSYNEARKETNAREYNNGVKTIAYLLEGNFQSLYTNRILPSDERYKTFKATGEPSKIVICSDGDMIVNDLDRKTGRPLPLGFDPVSQHTFGNKDFVTHAVDYLIDENGVIAARGKEVKLRPLDKLKTRDERMKWQLLNMGLPLILVGLFGLIKYWLRKKQLA